MRKSILGFMLALLLALPAMAEIQSGASGGRDVSGFDLKTNQAIAWCGIDFSFPSYFNVLDKRSTETWMTYFPEEEEFYASLMFQSQEFSGTQEEFIEAIPNIVESTMEGEYFATASIQKSEEISIAGLPGWTITYSEVDTDGDGVSTNGSYSFAYNKNTGKVAMITCIFDSNDRSQYDYLGDYSKVLEGAKLVASDPMQTEQSIKITHNSPVNIRKEADAKSTKVGTAQPGESFEYLKTTDNGWYKIRLDDGVIGWVSGKMATVCDTNGSNNQQIASTSFDEEKASIQPAKGIILTKENSSDLRDLLKVSNPDDPIIKRFAEKYEGETIEFDCYNAYIEQYRKYQTRFNYLVFPGDLVDFGTKDFAMAGFLIEDTGYYDLKHIGPDIPDEFGIGLHYRITAEIERFDTENNAIIITPTKIVMR